MDLEQIRQAIDEVDKQLVKLLEERMSLVSQVAAYKKETGKPVFDAKREEVLLAKIAALVEQEEYKETILVTFKDILKQSRTYQATRLGRN